MAGQTGPSASARWLAVAGDRPGGRPLQVLPAARSDAADRSGPARSDAYAVATPALAQAPGSGAPLVGLTLILRRPPELDDQALEPLVTGGILALSLTVAPTAEELKRAGAAVGAADVVPLFVRSARWTLIDETGEPFAEQPVASDGAAVAFSQTVTREVALSMLAALRGGESALAARCEATFRSVPDKGVSSTRATDHAGSGTTITFTTSQLGGIERRVTLERLLAEAVAPAREAQPLEALVRAVCPEPDGALRPVGWRITTSRRDNRSASVRAGFAAVGDTVAALPAVLKTSLASRINAHALAASDIAIRPAGLAHRWQIDDMVLYQPGSAEQNLPQIDGDAPIWPDRVDPARFWYAPEFSLVEPAAAASAADAPFLFAFSAVGHDQQGRPGLEAMLRFTMRATMSAAVQAAWEARGRPRCDPVPTNGLSVALAVPFRDEHGTAATQAVNATELHPVEGGVAAVFALTDQWARLAYGAIGTPGFQAAPARLDVAYFFQAYLPVRDADIRVLWGGKAAAVDRAAVRRPPSSALTALAVHQPVTHNPALVAHPTMVATHPLLAAPTVFVRPKTYGIRTQGRSAAIDAFLPCSAFGALYLQKGDPLTSEPDQAIGCRDAWTLGQIQLRLYEPVQVDVGVAEPGFTVYRSVQVPGRFLVLPKAYTISRFEPADGRAYRPAIYLYSNVDANHPERTTCILTATLRPSVTPAARRALIDALRAKTHPNPTLEWPTELSVDPSYTWAIPGGPSQITPAAARTPEGFQVSLAAGVDQILLLKAMIETSGVTAGVAFKFADGTTLQSTLVVDLRRIDGPWESGAVTVEIAGVRATLTNRVERAADVQELLVYANGARAGVVGVERRLEPQAALGIDLPAGVEEAAASYALANTGASLDEIRTFVEDIYTNVVFVSMFDLATERLQKVTVEGLIAGVAGAGAATLEQNAPSGEMAFVQPLTAYLSQPTLQYRATFVAADGAARSGPWRDWRLDVRGNVIELGKDEIQEV